MPPARHHQAQSLQRAAARPADDPAHPEQPGEQEGRLLGDQVERRQRALGGCRLLEDVHRKLVGEVEAEQRHPQDQGQGVHGAGGVDRQQPGQPRAHVRQQHRGGRGGRDDESGSKPRRLRCGGARRRQEGRQHLDEAEHSQQARDPGRRQHEGQQGRPLPPQAEVGEHDQRQRRQERELR